MYKLCLIGNPVEHSLSPFIHAEFGRMLNVPLQYKKIEAPLDQFSLFLDQFKKNGGHGCNITHPFKEEAYRLMDDVSDRAVIAKSVNTISFTPGGKMFGDNTDGIGFVTDVLKNHCYGLKGKRIVILGAGGAARGILHPLLMHQPVEIKMINRSHAKSEKIQKEFSCYGNISIGCFSDLKSHIADVVVNTLPAQIECNLPESFSLSEDALCYDLNYILPETFFMKWAKSKKAAVILNGMGMLIEQAAESFYVWTGKRVPNLAGFVMPACF